MYACGTHWFHLAILWSMVGHPKCFKQDYFNDFPCMSSFFMIHFTFPPSHLFSVPLPWERGHCAAVCSQTAAADHWRQKGLCVRVWHPPEAAAPHFPGPWLSHQGPRTGCLRGLLRHWVCRGQHEGDRHMLHSLTHSLTQLPKHIWCPILDRKEPTR